MMGIFIASVVVVAAVLPALVFVWLLLLYFLV